ncbi:MAG: SDR family oxidoreductase [Akkermansiaceae bacterium]
MKKIVITGAKGLLGEACCRLLAEDYEVISLTRAEVDLADRGKLSELLDRIDFDFLINTAAMSGLEQCLGQPELAQKVNTEAPRVMAEICQQKGAKMMQVSTDYVLDGREDVFHVETSGTRGSGVYSKTKLAAEQVVAAACENSVIVRVSWLFGHGRETFVDQVLNTALAGECGCYIGDKFSVPNFSDFLVPVMCDLLESDLSGVVHLTSDSRAESWFSYAEKIIRIAINLGILNDNSNGLEQNSLGDNPYFKEERPRYTVMRPKRLSEELNVEVRNWEDGLRVYLQQKSENSLTNK